jgi:hypothetical protein
MHPPSAPWRHPLSVAAVATAIAVGCVVLFQALASQQFGNPVLRPDSREYLLGQVCSALSFASAIFLGVFLAGLVRDLLGARAGHMRREALLRTLHAELAISPLTVAIPGDAGYRDPLRLTLLPRLLDGTVLDADGDRDLLAALLVLQAAVGRYNDLVLTNAVILVNGDDSTLDALARRYQEEVQRAVATVRRHLPVGPAAAS